MHGCVHEQAELLPSLCLHTEIDCLPLQWTACQSVATEQVHMMHDCICHGSNEETWHA